MKFRHKRERACRAGRSTVVVGRAGRHVLLEVYGVDGNRVVCCPRGEAEVELAKVSYCEPGDRRDGEAVEIRKVADVYLLQGDRVIFRDHLDQLQRDGEGRPVVRGGLWVSHLCARCRAVLAPRRVAVPA